METNKIRKIEARVEVSYGNEEIAGALDYQSSDKNPISRFECLFNNKHTPSVSAFTLEGGKDNAFSTGRELIDPEITGWWSKSLSGSTLTENGGYAFEDAPVLNIDLGTARPIKLLQIYGDPKLTEFPVKVNISLYRTGTGEGNETPVQVYSYDHINTETGVERITWNIDLLSVMSEAEKSSVGLENGYITGITDIHVKILEWNKPQRVSKIYRCYDDIIERYEMNELKSFECVRELPNTGEISYGLVSGSCSATLLNNKGRKFDLGYLSEMAHINRRIIPFINKEKLGSFYIKEWDIEQDDMFVKCSGNDRLMDFQDITFEGCMPGPGNEIMSFKDLFARVLDSAKKNFVKGFSYEIDDKLSQFDIEPYLPRESVWDVLQMLCEASMSYVFVDKNDVIQVKSEMAKLADLNCTTSEENGSVIVTYKDKPDEIKDNVESQLTVDPDNAFSINVPFFADIESNQVEIGYYRKVIKEDQELYRESLNNDVPSNSSCTFLIEFEKYCVIKKVQLGEREYSLTNEDLTIEQVGDNNKSDFIYKIIINTRVSIQAGSKFIVNGDEITFEKQALVVKNTKSLQENALSLYTHPNCELVQSKSHAINIAAGIMRLYRSGTRTVTSEWRGEQTLNLLERFNVKDRFGGEAKYMITSIKNSVDGGFRQEVKGIRKEQFNKGTYK